jgi:DDE superfamily endonuclease
MITYPRWRKTSKWPKMFQNLDIFSDNETRNLLLMFVFFLSHSRFSRARNCIECAFGILSGKWRIFKRPIQAKIETVNDIIKACVVLHNFVIDREKQHIFENPPTATDNCLRPLRKNAYNRCSESSSDVRNYLKEAFISSHSVDWQYTRAFK